MITRRFILTWLVIAALFLILDMIFGLLGGLLTTVITGEAVVQPVDMESKILWGILFEVINAFILVSIYSLIYRSLPGKGWLKGLSYGFIIWGLRVLMWAFTNFIMFDISAVLLFITTILGLFEVLILGVIIAVLYRADELPTTPVPEHSKL